MRLIPARHLRPCGPVGGLEERSERRKTEPTGLLSIVRWYDDPELRAFLRDGVPRLALDEVRGEVVLVLGNKVGILSKKVGSASGRTARII